MKNSSFRSKTLYLVLLLNALIAGMGLIAMTAHGWPWPDFGWGFLVLSISGGASLLYLRELRRTYAPLTEMEVIVRGIAAGQMGRRFTGIPPGSELESVCWALNDVLDQLETCFREQRTALAYAGEHKYFRRTLPTGLHGAFASSLEDTNRSLDALAATHQEQMRNHLLSKAGQLNTDNLVINLRKTQRLSLIHI